MVKRQRTGGDTAHRNLLGRSTRKAAKIPACLASRKEEESRSDHLRVKMHRMGSVGDERVYSLRCRSAKKRIPAHTLFCPKVGRVRCSPIMAETKAHADIANPRADWGIGKNGRF